MKTFDEYLAANNLELPVPATTESAKRGGISANYPDAYIRSQYPHKYFNPSTADADFKLSAKPRKGPDGAAN